MWFSDTIMKAKCDKYAAERRWRNSVLTVHKDIYFNARTQNNCLLDAAKASYYHDKITQSGNDVKAFHQVLDDILPHTKEVKLPTHTHHHLFWQMVFAFFFKG